MYSKGVPVPIRSSASLLYNNFDILPSEDENETLYGVVHKAVVLLFNPLAAKENSRNNDTSNVYKKVVCKGESLHSSSIVLQSKWCVLPSRSILVLTSAKGVQMFEADGSIMIFWQALSTPPEGKAQYARGISAVGDRHICIGTADGSILVFDVPTKGTAVKLQENLTGHDVSISDIHANHTTMASGDESGKILLWKSGGHFQKLLEIDGFGYPCSSIRLWKSLVVAGYGSGHVRIFNAASGNIKTEIAAHAKWINAIDISNESALLLTSSEDSYCRVWNLETFDLIFQDSPGDVQITGARFLNESGSSFGLTGYDFTDVFIYQK